MLRSIKTLILFVCFMAASIWLDPKPVMAADAHFTHVIKAAYSIKKDQSATVSYSFTTENKVGNDYLKTFSLKLPFKPVNVSVSDSPTPIRTKEVKDSGIKNLYVLDVEVVNPVYGINKKFEWRLNFNVESIIIPHGIQSALVLPTFDDPAIQNYEVKVNLPDDLGPIRYVYGKADVLKDTGQSIVTFSGKSNSLASFILLFGNEQQYEFEANKVTQDTTIYLPQNTPYQEVVYTQFPKRTVDRSDVVDPRLFVVHPNETLKAYINTMDKRDPGYKAETEPIVNQEWIEKLSRQVETTGLNKTQIAQNVFALLLRTFELNDYLTTVDTTIDLSREKNKVNPAELNSLFRQILTSFSIENRGDYGYVYPIQAFKRDQAITEQHIWSEFWDGAQWIVVDPTWYVFSKGTDYFDKNAYHHVKFGTYHELSELKDFFAYSGNMRLSPTSLKEPVEKKIELAMSAYDDTYLNKEFRVVFTNNSNQPLTIDSIAPVLNMANVRSKESTIKLKKVIYPGAEMTIHIPLEYGLLLGDRKGNAQIQATYSEESGMPVKETYEHAITIKSNISSYLSQIILGVVLLFFGLTVGSFIFLKK